MTPPSFPSKGIFHAGPEHCISNSNPLPLALHSYPCSLLYFFSIALSTLYSYYAYLVIITYHPSSKM